MATYNTAEEAFGDHPNLLILANRLGRNEEQVAEHNRNAKLRLKKNALDPSPLAKEILPERSYITEFFKNGQWNKSLWSPQIGKEKYLEDLSSCLQTQKPDAIRIHVLPGGRTNQPTAKAEVWFNEAEKVHDNSEPDVLEEEESKFEKLEQAMNEKFENLLGNLPKGKDGDQSVEIMQLNFNAQIKEIKHQTEIDKINAKHEAALKELAALSAKEKEELENTIEGLKEEILDLQDDLKEVEGDLGSVQAEIQKKKENAIADLAVDVLKRGITGFLKSYPKVTSQITGLDEKALGKMWLEAEQQMGIDGSKENKGSEASFSEASSGIDFTGVNEEQQKGILFLVDFLKKLDYESFQKVILYFDLITNEDATLNPDSLNKIYAFMHNIKTQMASNAAGKKEEPAHTDETTN